MRVLDRKLLREIRKMRGQAIAIGLIVACGIACWVTVLIAYRGLKGTLDTYYREYRMADVFATVKKAPRRAREALERVPGVRAVEARIVFEVSIDLPEVPEPCYGRVVSVPDQHGRFINDLHLVRGHWFAGDGNREVIIGDQFAKEHGLEVGDRLRVIMNNRKEALTIAATALSPEYVYMIRAGGGMLPDPEHFTVLWFSQSFAESVFDFEDAANDFVALFEKGAHPEAVLQAFDRELEPYGAYGAYLRKDQISNWVVSDEIQGLEGTATMVPTVFLGVAAFVIHMLLSRLVRTQRTQISVFRAFGYSTRTIGIHYLKLAMLIGAAGAVLGSGVGLYFAKAVLKTYARFYQFPVLRFGMDPAVILSGIGVSLLFAALGAISAARKAARIQPADGMRPEAPGVFQNTAIERWRALWLRLGFLWRMVFRNVARGKRRAIFTIGGISLAGSIIFLAFFTIDTMDELLYHTNFRVNLQDATVTLNGKRGNAAIHEIQRLPGVLRAEPELVVPVRLVNGHRWRRVGIFGLYGDGELRGLIDDELRPVAKPLDGLLLTGKLADVLGVRAGDRIEARVLEGERQVLSLPVEGTVDEYLGTNAYADLHRLSRWIGEESALTSARLLIDHTRKDELSAALKELPAVESVTYKEQEVRMFEETLVSSMAIMSTVFEIFAGIIAFGVIYNASRIALAERERTLASMRVLGFRRKEVAAVLTRENTLLTVVSIPLGVALGIGFSYGLARAYDTELFRFPFIITWKSILLTAASVTVFTVLANFAVRRRIKKLDLVEALKSRE